MSTTEIILLFGLVFATISLINVSASEYKAWKRVEDLELKDIMLMKWVVSLNPHCFMLGAVVDARKYDMSDWVRCNVICASWKGAVRVRPVGDDDGGWWVSKDRIETHVRRVK